MALPRIVVEVSADTVQALGGLEAVETKLEQLAGEARRTGAQTDKLNRSFRTVGARSGAMGRGIQNAAWQMGDFAVQVGAGTSASIALGQQLPQLIGGFGVWGAVLGAAVAVAVPLVRVLQDMKKEGSDLTTIFGSMQPVAQGVVNAFRAIRDAGIAMAEIVLNNLDRIISVGIAAAAIFGTRMVAAFIAARVAAFSFAGALVAVRTALIRTGIGAIIIGAGELIYRFSQLSQAAGGFGNAVGLLWDLVKETFTRIGARITILKTNFQLIINDIQYAWTVGLGEMQIKFAEFMDSIAQSAPDWMNLFTGNADAAREALSKARTEITDAMVEIMNEQDAAEEILAAPQEALEALREVLRSIKDENLDLGSLLSGGTDDEDGKGKGKSAWEAAIENIEKTRQSYEGLRNAQQSVWSEAGNLIQQFAGKSKAAAIAVIAIQKGLSIAQIISNTAAAQLRALADLGPIAGPPVAAKIGLYGKLQAALVAATGLAQAAGAGRGGQAPNLGRGGGGDAGSITAQETRPQMQRSITIIGDRFNRKQAIAIAEFMNEGTDDGLVIRGRG